MSKTAYSIAADADSHFSGEPDDRPTVMRIPHLPHVILAVGSVAVEKVFGDTDEFNLAFDAAVARV